MTNEMVLYVDETCRDQFAYILDEEFGKNKWKLIGDGVDGYNVLTIPNVINVPIMDIEEEQYLGRAEITNEFYVEEAYERYVEIRPFKIKIYKVKKDDKVCMQCNDLLLHSETLHTSFGCCVPGCGCRVVNVVSK